MKYIKINPADNVAVALQDLPKGEVVEGVKLQMDIPRGHKVVLKELRAGNNVIKYGYPIGHLTRDAAAGTLVDHSCIKTNLEGLLEYKYEPSVISSEVEKSPSSSVISSEVEKSPRTFCGFRRSDGQVGIRNQIWIIPTVGCVNGICEEIARRFREEIQG